MWNFNSVFERIPGNCKWDVESNVIPLSVADMDFQSPPCVVEALKERVEKGLFGYQVLTDRDYEAVIRWRQQRHGQQLQREHLLATPGVLNTMRAAIYALTNPGDPVIVQTPLHTPSVTSASMRGRRCLDVPMNRDEAERYTMDFAGLEAALRGGARVLAFCSPNNPTGRVWTGEELEQLAWLVRKYDAYVISDEIHADLIYPGHKFLSLGALPEMADRTVTVFSPSKTFNFGGFHIATGVIPNAALRQRISDILYESGACCGRPDAMAITAQTAAYEQGGPWLDGLMEYLQKNVAWVLEGLEDTPLKATAPEASILMWINCEAMGWDTETYNRLMNWAGILPDPGHYYFMDNHAIDSYHGPQTHFRINIATPTKLLRHALARLKCCL